MRERQTGHTTQQMRDAARDAVYVWPVAETLAYAFALADRLGRRDLYIVPVASNPDKLSPSAVIVLDHAARGHMTARQDADWQRALDLRSQVVLKPTTNFCRKGLIYF